MIWKILIFLIIITYLFVFLQKYRKYLYIILGAYIAFALLRLGMIVFG